LRQSGRPASNAARLGVKSDGVDKTVADERADGQKQKPIGARDRQFAPFFGEEEQEPPK